MDRNKFFMSIQNAVADIPLLVIGSGSSVAYGLPSIKELEDYLLAQPNSVS